MQGNVNFRLHEQGLKDNTFRSKGKPMAKRKRLTIRERIKAIKVGGHSFDLSLLNNKKRL